MSESVYLVAVNPNGRIPEVKKETDSGSPSTEPKIVAKGKYGWVVRVLTSDVLGAIIEAKNHLSKKLNYDLWDNR